MTTYAIAVASSLHSRARQVTRRNGPTTGPEQHDAGQGMLEYIVLGAGLFAVVVLIVAALTGVLQDYAGRITAG